MKVGVVVDRQAPETGGAHAYETSVLAQLGHVRSQHEFTLLLGGNTGGRIDTPLQTVDLCGDDSPAAPPRGLVRRVSRAVVPASVRRLLRAGARATLGPLSPKNVLMLDTPVVSPIQRSLERAIDDIGLDAIWFLTMRAEIVSAPFFTTVWDLQHRLQPYFPEVSVTGWDWNAREQYYRQILPRAARIFTGTQVGKDEIVRFYGVDQNNVVVIPFAPRPLVIAQAGDGFAVDVRQKYSLGAVYLLYPAQFWPHKNHVNLLLALHHLKTHTGLDPTLVLVGADKGNLDYVQALVTKLGLQSQVRLPGFVPEADLAELYRHASALVFPSFFGPDNFPPLEAFSLGCPVIAARVPGATEQLGDAALFFDPAQPEDLAQCIAAVLRQPELRTALCQKGMARVSDRRNAYAHGVIEALDAFEPFRRAWQRGYQHT